MSRPSPSPAAIDRIRALGEKAFVAFLDEVSETGARTLSDSLPPVPGFRKNSKLGIKQRKRALFKEFAGTRNSASSNLAQADQSLYGFWRLWAIEHLGDPDGINALIDAVEAIRQDDGESSARESAEAVAALFTALKKLSIDNECSRENIERFLQFSPFDESPEIRSLVDGSKPAAEIERDLAAAGLPKRLQQDEEEIKSIEGQLHVLLTRIDALSEEGRAAQKAVDALRSDLSRLASEHEALSGLLEEEAKAAQSTAKSTANRLTTQERDADAFAKEVRERLTQVSSDITALAKDFRQLGAESSSGVAVFEARVAALEQALAGTPRREPERGFELSSLPFQPHLISTRSDEKVVSIESFEGAATSVASNLERLGLKKSGARPLAEEICAAAFTRQVAFFKGAQANAVARSAALSLAGPACVRASMPVGLTSGEAIDAARDLIGSTAASSRALLIEGVNRTALDVYAEAVTDLMEVSVPPSAGRGFEFIFATLSQGVASLAVEPRQLELGPIFDLDHLDWRLRRTVAAPAPGCISVDALLALRSRLEKASVESEELVRLLRRFQPKKNSRIEGGAFAAYAALSSIDRRGPPSALQSLAFGWIVPLWLALDLSKEQADSELDDGKCDSETPDPRLASILASADFPSRESAL